MNATRATHRPLRENDHTARLRWYLAEFGRYPTAEELIALREATPRQRRLRSVGGAE